MSAMAAIVRTVSSPFTRRAKIPNLTNRARQAADFVRANPGCRLAMVVQGLKCARGTAQIHLQVAKLNGLIRCDFAGRFSKWYPHAAPD